MAHNSPLIAAFFCALLAVSGQAHAAKRIQFSHFPPNPGVAPGGGWKFTPGNKWADPPPQRVWIDGVYGDVRRVGAEDAIRIAGKAGELAVTARSVVTVGEAAAVVARCLGNPVCVAAAGAGAVVMAELYRQYRIRPAAPGGLEFDPGGPEAERDAVRCEYDGFSATDISKGRACDAVLAKLKAKPHSSFVPGYQYTDGVTNKVCYVTFDYYTLVRSDGLVVFNRTSSNSCPGNSSQTVSNGWPYTEPTRQKYCQQVDFGDPSNSYPSPGRDGKCPTGRYQPIDPAGASDQVKAVPPDTVGGQLKDSLREALEGGQTVEADFETSGPAKQIGSPSSTTTTNGQGTTTTTTTPEYNYRYDGDTITYETVNITQTCVGANACSNENATETKTETKPPPKEGDEKDPCSIAPDRAGCAKLGTPGEGEDIKKKDIPVSITPDTGWGADTGSCPAPIKLANGLTVDPFGLVCKYMAGIRFAVIGVAWLIAAFIFLGRIE